MEKTQMTYSAAAEEDFFYIFLEAQPLSRQPYRPASNNHENKKTCNYGTSE